MATFLPRSDPVEAGRNIRQVTTTENLKAHFKGKPCGKCGGELAGEIELNPVPDSFYAFLVTGYEGWQWVSAKCECGHKTSYLQSRFTYSEKMLNPAFRVVREAFRKLSPILDQKIPEPVWLKSLREAISYLRADFLEGPVVYYDPYSTGGGEIIDAYLICLRNELRRIDDEQIPESLDSLKEFKRAFLAWIEGNRNSITATTGQYLN